MSFHIRVPLTSVESKHSIMVSKLILLLQQHIIQLMSLIQSHFDYSFQKLFHDQKKFQKYKVLLGNIKLFEQQKLIEPKYSHLCQTLLNKINLLDDLSSNYGNTFPQKPLSLSCKSSKSSNLALSNRSFYRKNTNQKTLSSKHSLDLKKLKQTKIQNPTIKMHIQNLRNFERYKKENKATIFEESNPSDCKKIIEPCPGKSFQSMKEIQQMELKNFPSQEEKQPTLPNLKEQIIIKSRIYRNQTSYRTMTEFSREKNLQKIDEQVQNYLQDEVETDNLISEKEIYSFKMVQTPSGTVYGKESQLRNPPKCKFNMYKKLIDRTHRKRASTQSN